MSGAPAAPVEPKVISADMLRLVQMKAREKQNADRAARRAALELEQALEDALVSVEARPGWMVNLETGAVTPPPKDYPTQNGPAENGGGTP